MHYTKDRQSLQVRLQGDFNLNAVRQIRELFDDREELTVDLSHSRFVNSEAILYLQSLMQSGKTIRLKEPPKIFFEVLHILGLHESWDLKKIVES